MARTRRPEVREKDFQGFKYFDRLMPLLDRLHDVGTARDKASNRQLFYDQYALLMLLFFFNPILTSVRGLTAVDGSLLVLVRRTKPNGTTENLWLITDRLDLDAELIALAYRYRWGAMVRTGRTRARTTFWASPITGAGRGRGTESCSVGRPRVVFAA